MTKNNLSLVHFLDFNLWNQALKLLNFQINCQKDNKHYRTLSMIYYKTLGNAVEYLKNKDYFNQKVANNLFYGLEKEFAVFPYIIPKPNLGLRNYKFFTYPMRAVYYAIGLYLLKLSYEFLENYLHRRRDIKSYYGGRIYFENDELQVTRNNVYYMSYYKDFRNQVIREANNDFDNKVVIKLDIQNYYDEISIPRLFGTYNSKD